MTLPGLGRVQVLSLADLVRAKKTQRDKDWPMVRRLLEADYYNRPSRPSASQVRFWLKELRTAKLLVELSRRYSALARKVASVRPVIQVALSGGIQAVETALQNEEQVFRTADRAYWEPLRAELLRWRRGKKA